MAVPKVGQGTCYVNITKVHLCFYVVSLCCFEWAWLHFAQIPAAALPLPLLWACWRRRAAAIAEQSWEWKDRRAASAVCLNWADGSCRHYDVPAKARRKVTPALTQCSGLLSKLLYLATSTKLLTVRFALKAGPSEPGGRAFRVIPFFHRSKTFSFKRPSLWKKIHLVRVS